MSYPPEKKQVRGYGVELTSAFLVKAPAHDLRDLLDRLPALARPRSAPISGGRAAALEGNLSTRLPVNRTNVALIHSMLGALASEYVTEYDHWLRVGFALHSFDDGNIGLALWERFSNRCPQKAQGTDFVRLWAGFGRDYDGKKISVGWLRANAQEHGWRAPCRWDRSTETVG